MKNLLTLFIVLASVFSSFGMNLESVDTTRADSTFTVIQFDDLGGMLIYKSESPELKIVFGHLDGRYKVVLDNDTTEVTTNLPICLSNLQRGDHTLTIFRTVNGDTSSFSQTFKIKNSPPFISNDAVVFGLLMIVLFLIFKSTELNTLKTFYKYVPALLLCYFIPATLNSFGIISSEESNLYFIASRYLLPASLVLLCLSIDLKGILKLGPKALAG